MNLNLFVLFFRIYHLEGIIYFVYVIKSAEGYRYTGMTENLEFRLLQHNDHSLSQWTRRGKNWEIIYIKVFDNKSEALRYEKWLKSGVGRDFLKNSVKNY
ncbi:MAG: hypothetical protein SCALA702_06390 [Melioribacteraceae bacterium]|nr:MAG: hypothetical protein SCALA702_06390 [Melioribacteraceae bacterium]